MSRLKIFYLLAASLLAFANVATAAVYDFGNLHTSSPGASSVHYNLENNDAYVNSMRFDFYPTSQSRGGLISENVSVVNLNRENRISIFEENDLIRLDHIKLKSDNKYMPITSPVPEPETYAMMLAGLALIGLTARRRKEHS